MKDYSAYRSSLLFWALVDLIYNMFKVRKRPGPSQFQEVWDVWILAQTPLVATFQGSSLTLGALAWMAKGLYLERGTHPQLRSAHPAVHS